MAISIVTSDRISFGGAYENSTTLVKQVLGEALLPAVTLGLTYGTGADQVNAWYVALRTLGATTTESLDLRGGLTDPEGATVSFEYVKRVVISISSPDGTKSLIVGPQGVANAAQLWHGGTGASNHETTYSFLWKERPITGWATTAGTADLLPIQNPGGASVTYGIWILGVAP